MSSPPILNVSGFLGKVVLTAIGGSYSSSLPFSWWDYHSEDEVVKIMNLNSAPFYDILASGKICMISFGGWWKPNFNPFMGGSSTGALQGLKLGGFVSGNLTLFSNLPNYSDTICPINSAVVVDWHVSDNADAVPEYSCILLTNDIFSDFSGGVA